MDYTAIMKETLSCMGSGRYMADGREILLKLDQEQMEEAEVLLPDQVHHISAVSFGNGEKEGKITCVNMDSFACLRKMEQDLRDRKIPFDEKETLVLNFANAVHPGGGVREGARAQEEDLCRTSTLLASLEGEQAQSFYRYNLRQDPWLASDALFFSPHVEIMRDSSYAWLSSSVLTAAVTCAAPIYRPRGTDYEIRHYKIAEERIRGLLACCSAFGYRRLVLGAWGCGAFMNDAERIASLFEKVLVGENMRYDFDHVAFAVLDRSMNQYNFRSFAKRFAE